MVTNSDDPDSNPWPHERGWPTVWTRPTARLCQRTYYLGIYTIVCSNIPLCAYLFRFTAVCWKNGASWWSELPRVAVFVWRSCCGNFETLINVFLWKQFFSKDLRSRFAPFLAKGTSFTVNLQFKSEITEIHQLVCSLELRKTGSHWIPYWWWKVESPLTVEFRLQTARLPYNIFQCNWT